MVDGPKRAHETWALIDFEKLCTFLFSMARYTFGEHAGKAVVVTGANGLKLGCAVLATEGEEMIRPHMLVS